MRMFLRPEYLIAVDHEDYGPQSLDLFLKALHIYMTSAVKCALGGNADDLGERVITNCRERFLDPQLALMGDTELILPMGKLAIASVMRRRLQEVDLSAIVGKPGVGIVERDPVYQKTIIALPHPSGTNTTFNPPVIVAGDSQATARQKAAFARALRAIRRKLREMDYPLRPALERETPGPLERFL